MSHAIMALAVLLLVGFFGLSFRIWELEKRVTAIEENRHLSWLYGRK